MVEGMGKGPGPASKPMVALEIEEGTADQLLAGAPIYRPLKPVRFRALQMKQGFCLIPPSKSGNDSGEAGDYLLENPSGGATVMSAEKFAKTLVKIERKTKE